MAIGRTGSFATTEAPQDNVLQSMRYVDQLDYRAKQDKALADQEKAKKDAENLKEIDDYRNKFGVNLTGNQNINDLVIPYASQARDKAAELTKRIQLSSNNQEKAKLMADRNRIVQSFDVLKQVPDILNAKAKEIAEGIEKGKFNERDVDAIQETLGQLEKGQAHLYVDDNGQARVTIFKTDENKNPTGIIDKEQTIVELINSATPYLKPTYDINGGIAEQFTSQVKLDETEIQKGFTTVTQKQLSDRVKQQAKKKGQEVSTIDSEVYELWQRMGNQPKRKFTEEDRQKVAKYVEEDLLNRYNTEYKKEIDQSGILAQQKFAYDKKKEDQKTATFGQVEVPRSIRAAGYTPSKGYKAVSVTSSKPFPILGGITLASVNSYTVTSDGTGKKRIIAEVVYPDVKTTTLTAKEQQAWDTFLKEPEKLTPEQDLEVSRISKGATNKTSIISLDEADSFKLAKQIGLNNQNEVMEAAMYEKVDEKSEREQWDEAWKSGKKQKGNKKTEADELGL